jgi:hypothetical protein
MSLSISAKIEIRFPDSALRQVHGATRAFSTFPVHLNQFSLFRQRNAFYPLKIKRDSAQKMA